MKRIVVAGITCSILSISNMAQSEDLMAVFADALTSDPTFLRAEANLKAVEEQLNITFANFLPQVDVGGSATQTESSNDTPIEDSGFTGDSSSKSYGYNFTLAQMIYNESFFVLNRQAKSQVAQAAAQYNDAKQGLIIRTAQRYFDVLSAIDTNDFAESDLKAIGRQLEQAKQRFDVGLVAITDVHEAQAGYDDAVARNILAKNEVDNSYERLRQLTGVYYKTLSALNKETPLNKPKPNDIEHWTKIALDNNLTIQATQHGLEVSRQTIKLQRAKHYPTVGLSARYNSSTSKTTNDIVGGGSIDQDTDPSSANITLNFNLNLYSGGSISSSTRQAQQRYNQAIQDLEFDTRAAQRDVRGSFLDVVADVSRVQALKQAVVSNDSALQATEAGFEVGTRTTVDVLGARTSLLRAQVNLSQARYTYILNRLDLQRAAGQLDEEEVQEINNWLQK